MLWQPIETAPRDETPFLAYEPGGWMYVAYFADGEIQLHVGYDEGSLGEPTHWMPLPESPLV